MRLVEDAVGANQSPGTIVLVLATLQPCFEPVFPDLPCSEAF